MVPLPRKNQEILWIIIENVISWSNQTWDFSEMCDDGYDPLCHCLSWQYDKWKKSSSSCCHPLSMKSWIRVCTMCLKVKISSCCIEEIYSLLIHLRTMIPVIIKSEYYSWNFIDASVLDNVINYPIWISFISTKSDIKD